MVKQPTHFFFKQYIGFNKWVGVSENGVESQMAIEKLRKVMSWSFNLEVPPYEPHNFTTPNDPKWTSLYP